VYWAKQWRPIVRHWRSGRASSCHTIGRERRETCHSLSRHGLNSLKAPKPPNSTPKRSKSTGNWRNKTRRPRENEGKEPGSRLLFGASGMTMQGGNFWPKRGLTGECEFCDWWRKKGFTAEALKRRGRGHRVEGGIHRYPCPSMA